MRLAKWHSARTEKRVWNCDAGIVQISTMCGVCASAANDEVGRAVLRTCGQIWSPHSTATTSMLLENLRRPSRVRDMCICQRASRDVCACARGGWPGTMC
mmetsp:Transcript_11307/g.34888  ORF Transcript_11307/g.34888 Transcript_11307/m.34888 type:complete len:100 (-) Transcript_11307:182-481(-)|eukprot:scaffold242349_cov30-Tisochrysis_lutea.AAC.5